MGCEDIGACCCRSLKSDDASVEMGDVLGEERVIDRNVEGLVGVPEDLGGVTKDLVDVTEDLVGVMEVGDVDTIEENGHLWERQVGRNGNRMPDELLP